MEDRNWLHMSEEQRTALYREAAERSDHGVEESTTPAPPGTPWNLHIGESFRTTICEYWEYSRSCGHEDSYGKSNCPFAHGTPYLLQHGALGRRSWMSMSA